ncbi:nitrogenase iron-molybdenum cofactor biosynthesis protein NifN [Blastochloris sulfoviridis]|uniref:nitrogenase iron-molybdenum cofactor biosynthesis protein NifN n=1 Tax=Blastochloris sulfoviridis TaxID=50712 RepID=UPI003CCC8DC0
MSKVTHTQKAATVNPLKSSQPLGAALAFLGVANAMPLFHGTQGCTSFALVLIGRHYKEVIPIQTTAMDEVAAILGGADHLEEAILNLKKRTNPALIGVCTTALVETRGEDFAGELKLIHERRGNELAGTEIVLAQTPDFAGSIEEGWSKATTAIIEGVVPKGETRVSPERINILPGSHLTVADLEAIRDTVEAFGLEPTILPDISGSLDGKVAERWIPTSNGGVAVEDIRTMGGAVHTIAIGEQMRRPAEALKARTKVPYTLFDTLTGLAATDRFVALLAEISGRPVPARVRRARAQLEDAMLDGHFHFGGKRVAIAAEPDLLYAMARFFAGLGAEVSCAVSASGASPILEAVPAADVVVGDLDDFETRAEGCDLLVTHSHGRQASERLGIPLMHIGFPIFDRLGAQHRHTALYEGTRDLVFEVANIVQAHHVPRTPAELDPFRDHGDTHVGRPQTAAH